MKHIFFSLVVFPLAVIFPGCPDPVQSTDVDQSKIYQVYSAEYDAEYLDVVSTAVFRMNSQTGSFVKLTGASYVKVNDQAMTEMNLFNDISYVYHISNSANLSTYKWEYKNGNNNVFINETNLNSVIITLQDIQDTVHKSQNHTFGWNEQIVTGETVTIEFRYNDSLLSSIYSTAAGLKNIIVSSSTLQQYPSGTIKVNAKKNDQLNTQQNNSVGGVMKRFYRSSPQTFVLVP